MRGLSEVMGRRVAPSGRVAALALSVVLVGAIAACTPGPGPTPTPTPTFSCTATAGQCTPQQAEKEAQAKKDHEAAEAALRGGLTELYRIAGEGGVVDNSSTLGNYFAEDELTSVTAAMGRFAATNRIGHGAIEIDTISFKTNYPKSSQEVKVCEDGTKFYTTGKGGKDPIRNKVHLTYTATLKMIDGIWKRTQSTESVEVASCEE